ncbi:hypothetical protein [Phytohalomonas tamaricis]|uniref:hypothetical protein n=1 Tax=Phytohalomonas tamaricis TaxID=2081032 RepID=UPI00131A342F|nr:hypothetical protein [Phytohalomonas tamaricis]
MTYSSPIKGTQESDRKGRFQHNSTPPDAASFRRSRPRWVLVAGNGVDADRLWRLDWRKASHLVGVDTVPVVERFERLRLAGFKRTLDRCQHAHVT